MTVETIQDVLVLTRQLHTNLADTLERASRHVREERRSMLLDYLSRHERELNRVLELSEKGAQAAALQTWCAEYVDKHSFTRESLANIDYSTISNANVMAKVLSIHDRIIELYRFLASRVEVPSTEYLLTSVLQLERHETMRMMRDAEELEDL